MTQEQASAIFSTGFGQQLDVIYVTSDDQYFIRYHEAVDWAEGLYTPFNELEDKTITEFYPLY